VLLLQSQQLCFCYGHPYVVSAAVTAASAAPAVGCCDFVFAAASVALF